MPRRDARYAARAIASIYLTIAYWIAEHVVDPWVAFWEEAYKSIVRDAISTLQWWINACSAFLLRAVTRARPPRPGEARHAAWDRWFQSASHGTFNALLEREIFLSARNGGNGAEGAGEGLPQARSPRAQAAAQAAAAWARGISRRMSWTSTGNGGNRGTESSGNGGKARGVWESLRKSVERQRRGGRAEESGAEESGAEESGAEEEMLGGDGARPRRGGDMNGIGAAEVASPADEGVDLDGAREAVRRSERSLTDLDRKGRGDGAEGEAPQASFLPSSSLSVPPLIPSSLPSPPSGTEEPFAFPSLSGPARRRRARRGGGWGDGEFPASPTSSFSTASLRGAGGGWPSRSASGAPLPPPPPETSELFDMSLDSVLGSLPGRRGLLEDLRVGSDMFVTRASEHIRRLVRRVLLLEGRRTGPSTSGGLESQSATSTGRHFSPSPTPSGGSPSPSPPPPAPHASASSPAPEGSAGPSPAWPRAPGRGAGPWDPAPSGGSPPAPSLLLSSPPPPPPSLLARARALGAESLGAVATWLAALLSALAALVLGIARAARRLVARNAPHHHHHHHHHQNAASGGGPGPGRAGQAHALHAHAHAHAHAHGQAAVASGSLTPSTPSLAPPNAPQVPFLSSDASLLLLPAVPVLTGGDAWEDAHVWTASDLILRAGYPLQEHSVTTLDGYVLLLHRVPRVGARDVALFQHGVLDTSLGWVANGSVGSQALAAWDAGVDVWLANARSNAPRLNARPDRRGARYWDYSANELACKDVAAAVEHIHAVKIAELGAARWGRRRDGGGGGDRSKSVHAYMERDIGQGGGRARERSGEAGAGTGTRARTSAGAGAGAPETPSLSRTRGQGGSADPAGTEDARSAPTRQTASETDPSNVAPGNAAERDPIAQPGSHPPIAPRPPLLRRAAGDAPASAASPAGDAPASAASPAGAPPASAPVSPLLPSSPVRSPTPSREQSARFAPRLPRSLSEGDLESVAPTLDALARAQARARALRAGLPDLPSREEGEGEGREVGAEGGVLGGSDDDACDPSGDAYRHDFSDEDGGEDDARDGASVAAVRESGRAGSGGSGVVPRGHAVAGGRGGRVRRTVRSPSTRSPSARSPPSSPSSPPRSAWREPFSWDLVASRGGESSSVSWRDPRGSSPGGAGGGVGGGGGGGGGAGGGSSFGASSEPYRLVGVGHSLGAACLLIYAVTCRARGRPHRLSRLVLMSPAGFHTGVPVTLKPLKYLFPLAYRVCHALFPGRGLGLRLPSPLLRHVAFKLALDLRDLPALRDLVRASMQAVVAGDSSEWDTAMTLPHYNALSMPAVSLACGAHFAQWSRDPAFRLFDYGSKEENEAVYGPGGELDMSAIVGADSTMPTRAPGEGGETAGHARGVGRGRAAQRGASSGAPAGGAPPIAAPTPSHSPIAAPTPSHSPIAAPAASHSPSLSPTPPAPSVAGGRFPRGSSPYSPPPSVSQLYWLLDIPVDLVAGSLDRIVLPRDVKRHYDALRAAKVPCTFREFACSHMDLTFAFRPDLREYVLARILIGAAEATY